MGFFDTLSGAVNYAAQNGSETFICNYKERLRKASDSVVRENGTKSTAITTLMTVSEKLQKTK